MQLNIDTVKTEWKFFKTLKIVSPYGPVKPLPSIYPKGTRSL